MVNIILKNAFGTDPQFVRVPGIVVSDPSGSSYVNRNSGAIVQSQVVEVVSLRDTTKSNPKGGRIWFQLTSEPINLLARRFETVTGLDVDASGQRLTAQAIFEKVEQSIFEFKTRQAATQAAAEQIDPNAPIGAEVDEQQELVLAAK